MFMNKNSVRLVLALLLGATFVMGMTSARAEDKKPAPAPAAPAAPPAPTPTKVNKAIAVLVPTAGNTISGTITFTRQADGILVEADVKGLKPNSKHGFHIHEYGDISAPDGMATGGHFNPEGHQHGAPDAAMRHDGDFGNLEADANGEAKYSRVDKNISFDTEQCILGRGVIVHADMDDLATQPTGKAGARIAQGVIGVAKG